MCRVLWILLFLQQLHSGRIQLLRQGDGNGQGKAKNMELRLLFIGRRLSPDRDLVKIILAVSRAFTESLQFMEV